LTKAEKNNTIIAEYTYDPNGLRTSKVVDGNTIHFIYEGNKLIFEKNITTEEVKSYVYAFGKLLTRIESTTDNEEAEHYYFSTDHLGSVRVVTDETGEVAWKGEFSAYGQLLFEETLDDGFDPEIIFAGHEYDKDIQLYYAKARWYDASTGRFVSVDPIKDGLNWYVYCSNNPLRFIDPRGLEDTPIINSGLDYQQWVKDKESENQNPTDEYRKALEEAGLNENLEPLLNPDSESTEPGIITIKNEQDARDYLKSKGLSNKEIDKLIKNEGWNWMKVLQGAGSAYLESIIDIITLRSYSSGKAVNSVINDIIKDPLGTLAKFYIPTMPWAFKRELERLYKGIINSYKENPEFTTGYLGYKSLEALAAAITLGAISISEAGGAGNLKNFSDIVRNPKSLWGKSVDEIKNILGEGWEQGSYGKTGTGWKFIKDDMSVFYHEGGRHGGIYYGFSSGLTGKVKIVGPDYINTPGDKATIIKIFEE